MSIDYFSICMAIPSKKAKKVFGALAPLQACGAIVGPDEETIVDGWVGMCDLDLASIAEEFAGERPAAEYWEGAEVDLPEEMLDLIGPEEGFVMTNRSSALAGLDRILAIPLGVNLLGGHAITHVPCKQIDAVKLRLARLWKQLGGKEAAAGILQSYLFGNANDDAAEKVIVAVESALTRAKASDADVLLMSAVLP